MPANKFVKSSNKLKHLSIHKLAANTSASKASRRARCIKNQLPRAPSPFWDDRTSGTGNSAPYTLAPVPPSSIWDEPCLSTTEADATTMEPDQFIDTIPDTPQAVHLIARSDEVESLWVANDPFTTHLNIVLYCSMLRGSGTFTQADDVLADRIMAIFPTVISFKKVANLASDSATDNVDIGDVIMSLPYNEYTKREINAHFGVDE